MKMVDMFPSKYLSGADLEHRPLAVTVRAVAGELVRPDGGDEVQKWVLYVEETARGVILCRTLAAQLAALLGDDTESWPGRRVELYAEPVAVEGTTRLGIRARAAGPVGAVPPHPDLQNPEPKIQNPESQIENPPAYLDGTPCSEPSFEAHAFRHHLRLEGVPPVSPEALRRWLVSRP